MEFLIAIAVILTLLFLSAFFSGGELAMMAMDEINLKTSMRQGSRLAKYQHALRSQPQRFLSTILIGYNVANITVTTYAAGLAVKYLAVQPNISEDQAFLISGLVMTVLITIFAELMPKTIAAIATDRVAKWVTYPLYITNLLLTPLNWLLEKFIMPMIYAMTGGKPEAVSKIGREELSTALVLAHSGGRLHSTDAAVAAEALALSTRDLADAMTPRVDIVAVPRDVTAGEALRTMIDSGFSRIPVHGEDLDEIVGVLFLKDLMRHSLRESLDAGAVPEQWEDTPAAPLMRQVTFFPDTKSVVEALAEIRQQRLHMAIVVDEHGGTAGIVTLEDILEELVGDIRDETDHAHSADIIKRGEGYSIVTGRARLDQLPEFRELIGLEAASNTIGGLMMEVLGRPAKVGDQVEVEGVKVTALKVLRTRIKLLRVEGPTGTAPDVNGGASENRDQG